MFDHAAAAAQLASITAYVGGSWSFSGLTVSGVLGELKVEDPRMAGSTDRLQVLTVAASALTTRPKRGDTLTGPAGKLYSVTRLDEMPSGLVEILVSPL